MKKVFLFLTATAFGFASMANGGWTNDKPCTEAQTIKLTYNEYADGDNGSGEKSYTWQGGNSEIITEAVQVAMGEEFMDSWNIGIGEQFSLSVEGTCDASGTFKTGLIDEQREAAYWFQISDFATPEVTVTAGETFSQSFVYTVKDLAYGKTFTISENGADVEVTPTANLASLVFGFQMANYAAATEFCGKEPSESPKNVKKVTFDFTKFEFKYLGDLSKYTKPYALANAGVADVATDGYKFQGLFTLDYDKQAATSDFFNFSIKGVATEDISSLMIAFWDGSENALPKKYATNLCSEDGDGMLTAVANIEKDKTFEVKGSLPIQIAVGHEDLRYQICLMALSKYDGAQIILDLKDADSFDVGANKGYGIPTVEVKEIAAADAIVNGVIYSEGAIVIFNQAGQKVAAASQEFAIASLGAGVYFAQTAEGSFSFVVK